MNKYEKVKTFMMGVITVLVFLILINATTDKSILKVKELHIVDEYNRTRIMMGMKNSIVTLDFYDSSGNERISLKQSSKDNVEFRMNAQHGIRMSNSDWGGGLYFYSQGKSIINIESSIHHIMGGSEIKLFNKLGNQIWNIDSKDY